MQGLLKVDEDGVTVLTSHVKGTEIRYELFFCYDLLCHEGYDGY